ncbi:hypothetical protein QN277_016473 [Acacia crassicarpa]|uniref:PGG domain-containing protein n=1 Tax=Acacia crassicarpa TaxID=499986 RepID=A0AAE1MWQ4_9FABA|nr:hypothetical protein QN277_016473 [Acacia crassicarpa]
MEENRRELCKAVSGQKWDEVAELYRNDPQIQAMKITKSEDTALHVAISLGAPEDKVVNLVHEIEQTNVNDVEAAKKTLGAQNEQQDTPLHYAASRGSPSICKRILQVHEDLACKPNKEGETALFLAALNGRKRTFLYLHSVCRKMGLSSPWWRRNNGDTILHCTIQREYFDLALEIIHLYADHQKIASVRNNNGVTPLHVLASIPSAFKSVTPMSLWDKLRYSYISVEMLTIETKEHHVVDVGNSVLLKADDDPTLGHQSQGSIRRMKEKHVWSGQIMEKLLQQTSEYEYSQDESSGDKQNRKGEASKKDKKSTALLMATKNGLIEVVKRILEVYPVAIYDKTDPKKRNIVLLSVEKRQTHVFKSLMKHPLWHNLRGAVDMDGNNVLHMASFLLQHMPRQIHGSVMQMQYEALWFQYVKESMPDYMSYQENKEGDTPDEIFAKEHKDLLKESNEWIKDTSGSYAIVSALIVSVTYATSYTVPGGTNETGKPNLRGQLAFDIFVFSILVSFCSSITSLAAFVAVFSSRKQPVDYLRSLPLKLCFGLTTFYLSVVSMLVSFCAAHFFELDQRIMKHKISPYALALVPLCLYTYEQIPLYWNLLRTTLVKEPQPRYVGDNVTM